MYKLYKGKLNLLKYSQCRSLDKSNAQIGNESELAGIILYFCHNSNLIIEIN